MCGIAGSFNGPNIDKQNLDRCKDLLKRRGPDASGHFDSQNGCVLIHTRLAVIDLDERSKQPFLFGNYVISFNGEIYNYIEIRNTLIDQGYKFKTDGDTEVLAASWDNWGSKCFSMFDGMWAVAIYDIEKRKLVIATDPFGEKPLLYKDTGSNGLFFSSRADALSVIGSFAMEPDLVQVSNYLVNGYKSLFKSNRTFLEGVKRLESGHMLIAQGSSVEKLRYWEPSFGQEQFSTEAEAVESVREALVDSVQLRLRSDVPIAFCLSGGVDSSTLIGAAVKECGVNATGFTIQNSDGRYDEADLVNVTKNYLGIESINVRPDELDFIKFLDTMIEDRMAPVATISYFSQNVLYQKMSEAGFKVSISGTGADELFTGYYDHHLLFLSEFEQSDLDRLLAVEKWSEFVKPIIRNPLLQDPNIYFKNPNFRDHVYYRSDFYASLLTQDWHETFTERHFSSSLLRSRMMNELFHEAVPPIVNEDDANAMFYSMENRSPFLSRNLLNVALRIPENKLIKNGMTKYYLREAARSFVHPDILFNRRKVGFNSSLFEFVDMENKEFTDFLLTDSPIFDLIDRGQFEKYILKGLSLNSDSKFLFNFINAKLFLEKFI